MRKYQIYVATSNGGFTNEGLYLNKFRYKYLFCKV